MSRRCNFLWYLLSQDEDSLLGRFFKAQCDSPTRGDWVSTVKQDLKDLEIEMNFDQIRDYTKEAFKETVKKQVKTKAFIFFTLIQQTHSKTKLISYKELTMQNYLCSENNLMTKKEKIFAFTSRAHMLDLRGNFKAGKTNIKCRLGCDNVEDQTHIYYCDALEDEDSEPTLRYTDIYGSDSEKIRKVTQRLIKRFQKLTTTVHRQPEPCAATDADTDDNHDNIVDVSVELDL